MVCQRIHPLLVLLLWDRLYDTQTTSAVGRNGGKLVQAGVADRSTGLFVKYSNAPGVAPLEKTVVGVLVLVHVPLDSVPANEIPHM